MIGWCVGWIVAPKRFMPDVTAVSFKELRNVGLINEQIHWKQRFCVPSDAAKGISLLMDLLGRYPALESDTT